jgi:hypothetical protein
MISLAHQRTIPLLPCKSFQTKKLWLSHPISTPALLSFPGNDSISEKRSGKRCSERGCTENLFLNHLLLRFTEEKNESEEGS